MAFYIQNHFGEKKKKKKKKIIKRGNVSFQP
jgi:hypothetical protein